MKLKMKIQVLLFFPNEEESYKFLYWNLLENSFLLKQLLKHKFEDSIEKQEAWVECFIHEKNPGFSMFFLIISYQSR